MDNRKLFIAWFPPSLSGGCSVLYGLVNVQEVEQHLEDDHIDRGDTQRSIGFYKVKNRTIITTVELIGIVKH